MQTHTGLASLVRSRDTSNNEYNGLNIMSLHLKAMGGISNAGSLDVSGGVLLHSNLTVLGNLGVGGFPQASNAMCVSGNASVGRGFATVVAPDDGLIVQGRMGVGKSNPVCALDVDGEVRLSGGIVSIGERYTPSNGAVMHVYKNQDSEINLNLRNVHTGSSARAGLGFDTPSCRHKYTLDNNSNVYWDGSPSSYNWMQGVNRLMLLEAPAHRQGP